MSSATWRPFCFGLNVLIWEYGCGTPVISNVYARLQGPTQIDRLHVHKHYNLVVFAGEYRIK